MHADRTEVLAFAGGDDLNAFAHGLVNCQTAEDVLALMDEFGRNPTIGNIIRISA